MTASVYLPLILGSWSIVATLAALVLALELGVQRRRIEYLEALAAGDWHTPPDTRRRGRAMVRKIR